MAGKRRLLPAQPLLLERACYGDPFEIMRTLRHDLERSALPDQPAALYAACSAAARSSHPGARLWAISELAILENPQALPTLIAALDDTHALVREQACASIERLVSDFGELRAAACAALLAPGRDPEDTAWRRRAHASIASI